MTKLWAAISGIGLALMPAAAWAEGMSGYSRGNAFLYWSAIAAVLIFGIHDVFHKKWVTWTAAVVIPVLFYLNLPAK
jgi:hypothetical protein